MRGTLILIAATIALASRPVASDVDSSRPVVTAQRVPGGGIQPRVAIDDRGSVHLIYFRGEPSHGDILYVRSTDGAGTFSDPIRVNLPNSEPGHADGVPVWGLVSAYARPDGGFAVVH